MHAAKVVAKHKQEAKAKSNHKVRRMTADFSATYRSGENINQRYSGKK
jgi:hypothetical protein